MTFKSMAVLESLYKLSDNWDSYNGKAPSKNCVDNAITFYTKISNIGIEPEHIGPTPSGGIGFTFDSELLEYTIEIDNRNRVIETIIKHFNVDYFSMEMTGINENFTFSLVAENLRKALSIKK